MEEENNLENNMNVEDGFNLSNKEEKQLDLVESFLRSGSYPSIMKGRPHLKANLRKMCKKYILNNDVLHFRYGQQKVKSNSKAPAYLRVIKKTEIRKKILEAIHQGSCYTKSSDQEHDANSKDDFKGSDEKQTIQAAAIGGHIGRDKTLMKLLDADVWWPGMNCDVRDFVKTCETCQRGNTHFNKAAPTMHCIPIPSKVWSQIGVDLCSLPKTTEGYVAICVVVDYFSKWVEAKPIQTKTAEEVATFLYELICRLGCVSVQINDQGREFCNAVCTKLHKLTGTKQRVTSAYHPQANGLVERQNRTIQGSLLKVLGSKQERWPDALQGVLFAFRTARHKSTGQTPFQMMYGRKAVLPCENQFFPDESGESATFDLQGEEFCVNEDEFQEHMNLIMKAQSIIHDEAMKNICKAQTRQKKDYENRHQLKENFKVGDTVLVYNLRRADRKGGRACQPYHGPYVIAGFTKNNNYRLKTTAGKPLRTIQHGCNLKRFYERSRKECEFVDLVDSELKEELVDEIQFLGEAVPDNEQFVPTTAQWRNRKCEELHMPVSKTNNERRTKKPLGDPLAVQEIVGDGNCLFRALSYEVTLSQEHHQFFRVAACNVLRDKRYKASFEANHIPRHLSANDYINESKMDSLGTWGTDVEIFALATLLNTRIAVFYRPPSSQKASWYYYNPQMSADNPNDMSIYLRNPGNHFERVKSVKTMY